LAQTGNLPLKVSLLLGNRRTPCDALGTMAGESAIETGVP
jgi:hypothetical protein